ncbi:MAG: TonB C-terminal domain-containing protein [Parvibaculum sp.]|nr:TonB C-terminal domain-containing protein [Parvibaculum sp.]
MSSSADVYGSMPGPDASPDAPHALSDFTVEHLVEPAKPLTLVQRSGPFTVSLLFNVALFVFLFLGVAYTLPPLSQEPEAIPVELVQQDQAPPPPQIQPQPVPEPEPEKNKPYEFKGSGDVEKDKAGRAPAVKADKSKDKPEKKAEKPTPDAPKQDEVNLPDWMKTETSGYDIPAPKASSRRADRGYRENNSADMREGDGAGDEYTNRITAQINAATRIPGDYLLHIKRSAIVSYTIDRRGMMRSARLVQSSGLKEFDLLVLQGLLLAGQFPAFPANSPDAVTLSWVYPKEFPQ